MGVRNGNPYTPARTSIQSFCSSAAQTNFAAWIFKTGLEPATSHMSEWALCQLSYSPVSGALTQAASSRAADRTAPTYAVPLSCSCIGQGSALPLQIVLDCAACKVRNQLGCGRVETNHIQHQRIIWISDGEIIARHSDHDKACRNTSFLTILYQCL